MESHELRQIAHRGLVLGPVPLLRYQPRGRRAEREGLVLVTYGLPLASLNKVAALGPAPPLARVRELADAFFAGQPYGVLVEADAGHPVEAELRAADWQVLEDEPALVLPAIPPAPALPAGLVVRPVTDEAGRRDFIAVAAAGFGASTGVGDSGLKEDDFETFAPPLACARAPDVAVLVGYAEGQPVSSAILYRVGDVAGITGVATPPAFRRRGYARALTWAALTEGAARGCRCATLGGLGASYAMYLGMGFAHVCNHRLYVPRG
jgi:ribosomal protein S18 acetylase RimI-like enzyme